MSFAVTVQGLRKSYGELIAVEDVSFEIEEGEIFGMVGPNGAGKTTTIECIEGLRHPDRGEIRVFGMDPHQEGTALRQRIGVQLQESALHPRMKVWETLELFSSFYEHTVPWEPLIAKLGLENKCKAYLGELSGGQKQRLHIALALLNDPQLVFLDELTTGLDPQARRAMWDLVSSIRWEGKTVFLTTHYMEEAERLCQRVAIIDHGHIIALDSPQNLIRNLNAERRVVFQVAGHFDPDPVERLDGVTRLESVADRVTVFGKGERLVSQIVAALEIQGCTFKDLHTEEPNLEDVFLALTGQEMRD